MLDDAIGVSAGISQRCALRVPNLPTSESNLQRPVARVIARAEVLNMGQTTAHFATCLQLPNGALLATTTAGTCCGLSQNRQIPRGRRRSQCQPLLSSADPWSG